MLERYKREVNFKVRRWMNMNVYDFDKPIQLAEEAAAEFDLHEGNEVPQWIIKAALEVFKA